ncbi:hypothetical protein [Macellibacteroides fermentans]|uniref:Uncharacterized protein n=1 Tax=Parabacteroides chartae TaxID=1037355 RepID=A0A1T5B8W0_9BACT|nr:hypothetical protein [Parabacteroides chartae]SKB43692.1 hypothetical protein SAMN05660349_01167 [Parabacteroides chartae]
MEKINIKLSELKLDHKGVFDLSMHLNKLSDAELLAWTVELQSRLHKSLEHLKDRCSDTINEGTDDEDYVFNEQKYMEAKAQINKEAIELLDKCFNFRFDEGVDLIKRMDIPFNM